MSSSDKEIVLITEYFHPDTAKTGKLMTDLAVGLYDRGLEIRVYTSQPNYHSGDNQRQPQKSVHEGVTVERIRAPQLRQSSLPRRLFNWTSFTIWMSVVFLFSQSEKERELIFVSNPPILPAFLLFVSKFRGWEYTYIVHDLYPDQPIELGYIRRGGLIDRIWSNVNSKALGEAKHVVALGPVMKDRICDTAGPGFDRDKVKIIHNWEDEKSIKPMEKEDNWFSKEYKLVRPFTVLYSGNIGEFHDLETLVEAAAQFKDENVKFLVIGEGDNKETIVEFAEELRILNETVKFLPYQSWEDLPYSLTSADVSVVTVKEGFEGVCVSSKLYTAMASGTPILGIVQPDDDEARIIDAFDAGTHVEQGNVDGIVEAIETWRAHPNRCKSQGSNARVAFEEYFTKDRSVNRYYRMLAGGTLEPDVTRTEAARQTS